MKHVLMILTFVMYNLIGFSQDTIKLYLDKEFKKTEKELAIVQRTAIIYNNRYFITDQFLNGKMINYAEYISVNPFIEDGLAKHYNEFGELYSTGKYINGKLSGKWIYYLNGKTDTVDYGLVTNYYKFHKDSCKSKQQIAFDSVSKKETLNIIETLKSCVHTNFHLPARAGNDKINQEIKINLIIDIDGQIKCPEILNDSNNIDFNYEVLRVLFLYKNNFTIIKPIKLTVPVVFNTLNEVTDEPALVIVDENATFQSGDLNNFRLYVQNSINYPIEAAQAGIQGKIIVQFAVNSKGYVVDSKILRGVHPALDNEVLRILSTSPKWIPGKKGGKLVKQQFFIPVIFKLAN